MDRMDGRDGHEERSGDGRSKLVGVLTYKLRRLTGRARLQTDR